MRNMTQTEMLNSRKSRMTARASTAGFQIREENDEPIIEGYFSVFNSIHDMGYGCTESIARGAFTKTLSGDIRALINHDTTLVLGRTSAHTLELREDEHGLWGSIRINPKDSQAMDLYERVKRGDVDQCSFGFEIVSEETEFRDDGTVHFTIREVKLYEVSCCTFPAYSDTSISARAESTREEIQKRKLEAWKSKMMTRLKGDV